MWPVAKNVCPPLLYTNDCPNPSPSITYLRYSDNRPILTLLANNNSIQDYHNTIAHFSRWCKDNHLHLNVTKTKELIISPPSTQRPISINPQSVQIVGSFQYLGITLDNSLNFDKHTTDIHKRSHQGLCHICKLKGLRCTSFPPTTV